ncbi:KAP family P-loop NTPase fold protein [Micromonospora sp. RB23]
MASIVHEVRSVDVAQGYVIALSGPWGSGKTSLLNLIRLQLDRVPRLPVVNFNPWMFSNTEQLVQSFFGELASQLRMKEDRLAAVATEIEAYGELLAPLTFVPIAGPLIQRASEAAGAVRKFRESRDGSVVFRKEMLAAELTRLGERIVVIIDDIDRLQTAEIRDIFKLVRLTASFPNVIYLLAFDRGRVEEALTESGIPGRGYLEKIVQTTIDVPVIADELLITQVGQALDAVLDGSPAMERFDKDRWPDVLMEVVAPLIRNVRDVRRFAASIRSTVDSLGGQIELVDLLALEAIRIFLPDVFKAIADAPTALTATRSSAERSAGRSDEEAVKRVLAEAAGQRPLVESVISRLFPGGLRHIGGSPYGAEWEKGWLKARRVAHPDILRLYLERTHTSKMAAFTDAERAFKVLADRAALEEFLSSIDPERIEDVISALEAFEGEYPSEAVPVAVTVVLNTMPYLPDRPRGMLELDARLVVSRVVLRLLRQLKDPDEVANIVREVLPEVTTLSARLQLVLLVGHRNGAGHKLVSEAVATELEGDLAQAVRSEVPADVSKEWDYLRVLYWAYRQAGGKNATLNSGHRPAVHAQVLITAKTETRRSSGDSRVVKREALLRWPILEELYGGQEALRQAIDSAREIAEEEPELARVIDLAERGTSDSFLLQGRVKVP